MVKSKEVKKLKKKYPKVEVEPDTIFSTGDPLDSHDLRRLKNWEAEFEKE